MPTSVEVDGIEIAVGGVDDSPDGWSVWPTGLHKAVTVPSWAVYALVTGLIQGAYGVTSVVNTQVAIGFASGLSKIFDVRLDTTSGTSDRKDLKFEKLFNVTALQGAADTIQMAAINGGSGVIRIDTNSTAELTVVFYGDQESGTAGGLLASANLSDLTNLTAAQSNLGLGSLALITPSGTPDATTFLRGDGTWAVPPAGGAVPGVKMSDWNSLAGTDLAAGDLFPVVDISNTSDSTTGGAGGSDLTITASELGSALFSLSGGMIGTNNLSELTNLGTARTNLGLGPLATKTTSGSPSSANYLRGDGAWTAVSGGGGGAVGDRVILGDFDHTENLFTAYSGDTTSRLHLFETGQFWATPGGGINITGAPGGSTNVNGAQVVPAPAGIKTAAWTSTAGGTITYTTTNDMGVTAGPHGFAAGQRIVIIGAAVAGYNQALPKAIAAIPTANTFTFTGKSDPGAAYTSGGHFALGFVAGAFGVLAVAGTAGFPRGIAGGSSTAWRSSDGTFVSGTKTYGYIGSSGTSTDFVLLNGGTFADNDAVDAAPYTNYWAYPTWYNVFSGKPTTDGSPVFFFDMEVDPERYKGLLIQASSHKITRPFEVVDYLGQTITWIEGDSAGLATGDNLLFTDNSYVKRWAFMFRAHIPPDYTVPALVIDNEPLNTWDTNSFWGTSPGLGLFVGSSAPDTVITNTLSNTTGLWFQKVASAPGSQTIIRNGTVTNGSPTITALVNIVPTLYAAPAGRTSRLNTLVGKAISGIGIPASTYIGAVTSTTISLSSSPTANTPVNATITTAATPITISGVQNVAGVLGFSGRLAMAEDSTINTATLRGMYTLPDTGIRWDPGPNGPLVFSVTGQGDSARFGSLGGFLPVGTRALGSSTHHWSTFFTDTINTTMTIDSGGNFALAGILTLSPPPAFGNNYLFLQGFNGIPTLSIKRATMTATSGSEAMTNTTLIGAVSFAGGYDTSGFGVGIGAAIYGRASELWSGTARGTQLEFYTVTNTTTTNSLVMKLDNANKAWFLGNVDIAGNLTVTGTYPGGGGSLPDPVTAAHGGTGLTTITNHGVLVGAGTGTVSTTSAGSTGQALLSGGSGADPGWSTVVFSSGAMTNVTSIAMSSSLSQAVYGSWPVQNGYAAGGTSGSPTAIANNGILRQITGYGQYDTTVGHFGLGFQMQVIAAGAFSSSSYPTRVEFYTTPVGSTTNTLALRLGSDQSATFGGAASFAGAVTLTGGLNTPLVVGQGGTGASTLTAHGVLLGNGTGTVAATAAGTSGNVLISGGASADPTWTASPSLTTITISSSVITPIINLQRYASLPQLIPQRLNGTSGSPTHILANDVLLQIAVQGQMDDVSTNLGTGFQLQVVAPSAWSTSNRETQAVFYTTPNGSVTNTAAITLGSDQSLLIGGNLKMTDAKNIVLTTTTGTMIGTGSTQKLGFYGATPVVRQTSAAAAPAGGTGTAAGGWDTAGNRDTAIALINAMRTALLNLGLMA